MLINSLTKPFEYYHATVCVQFSQVFNIFLWMNLAYIHNTTERLVRVWVFLFSVAHELYLFDFIDSQIEHRMSLNYFVNKIFRFWLNLDTLIICEEYSHLHIHDVRRISLATSMHNKSSHTLSRWKKRKHLSGPSGCCSEYIEITLKQTKGDYFISSLGNRHSILANQLWEDSTKSMFSIRWKEKTSNLARKVNSTLKWMNFLE